MPAAAFATRRAHWVGDRIFLEDYVSQAPGFAATLNSLVTEGVFVKFPRLKVVLIEFGRDLAAGLSVAHQQDVARRAR